MSDNDVLAKDGTEGSAAKPTTPIIRSASWNRLSADEALYFVLGHDAEISFLASSPFPVEAILTEDEDGDEVSESYRLGNITEEIVRVRMPPISAITLAFNIIARQASKGLFEEAKLQEQFQQILSLIPKSETGSGDE